MVISNAKRGPGLGQVVAPTKESQVALAGCRSYIRQRYRPVCLRYYVQVCIVSSHYYRDVGGLKWSKPDGRVRPKRPRALQRACGIESSIRRVSCFIARARAPWAWIRSLRNRASPRRRSEERRVG